jgi:SpoVK/Ycf46/Vps4 family AAA+-type ATPase
MNIPYTELFEPAIDCPDISLKQRLDSLVGLDSHKERLTKIIGLLINHQGIKSWAKKFHPDATGVLEDVFSRPPLVVLEGDVGSGKTELATTIGDAVARAENIDITILPLSLSTRGQGRVGEMTKLISTAFDYTIDQAKKRVNGHGEKTSGAVILLVDEADALTQSRESAQMHHEDKAGVNAFIRGVDRIGNSKLPAAVIMCTNRVNSLDPAIRRRAADVLSFSRPSDEQRNYLLSLSLKPLGFSEKEIEKISSLTGSNKETQYGFTFSDLRQRLVPAFILAAYPNSPVTFAACVDITNSMKPTPPFTQ